MKYIHIHSRRVKDKLIDLGNKQVDEERNKKEPKYFIYIFELTPKLLSDLTMITDNL